MACAFFWEAALKRADDLRFARDESQGGGIHAVTQTSRLRPIGKNVAKMAVADRAFYFSADYTQRDVFFFANVFFGDGFEKTRPARTGVKLAVRIKQSIVTIDAAIQAGAVLIVQCAGKGPFRCGAPRHIELQSRKLGLPLCRALAQPGGCRGAQGSSIVAEFRNPYRTDVFNRLDPIVKRGRADALYAHEHAVTA